MDVNTQIALVMVALSEDDTKLTTEKMEEIIPWVAELVRVEPFSRGEGCLFSKT